MSFDVGIDFGTSKMLVYGKDKGIVLNEPDVVAYDRYTQEIKAVGEEAFALYGKTTGNIISSYVFENKVYCNNKVVSALIDYIIRMTTGKILLIHPRICISLPGIVSDDEKKIFEECAYKAGAREVIIVDRVMSAAIGARIDIRNTAGNIIADIGTKLTDIAVISYGEIVERVVLNQGDNGFDNAIIRSIKENHGILTGRKSAHELKAECACVYSFDDDKELLIKGRSVIDGLLIEQVISSKEVEEALADEAAVIADNILKLLEKTDDKLRKSITDRGIILTGKTALLTGFENLMERHTGIQTIVGENPITASVTGTGIILEFLDGGDT